MKDTTFSYFPGVRFVRGYCTAEHGSPISGTVALDSDSVLYLFTSTKALDLLLLRHPIRHIDSTTALDYAQVALELSGHANAYSRLVRSADEGGPQLTKALTYIRGKPSMVIPMGIPRPSEWSVSFGRIEPGYERVWAYFTEIWVEPTGHVTVITDSLVSPLPVH